MARHKRYSTLTAPVEKKMQVFIYLVVKFVGLGLRRIINAATKQIIFSDQRHQYVSSGVSLFLYFDQILDLQQHSIRDAYNKISKLSSLGTQSPEYVPKDQCPFVTFVTSTSFVYQFECSDNIHCLCPQRNTCKGVSSPFPV